MTALFVTSTSFDRYKSPWFINLKTILVFHTL